MALTPGGQYQLCFGTGHTRRIPRLSSTLPNKVVLMMKCLEVDEDDGHEDDGHNADHFYDAGMTRRRCPISVNTTTAPPMMPYVSGPM